MRVCPKCGAEYAETDIRSMCGSCLVSLVAAKAAPASVATTADVGPVTLGTSSATPLVLPTITLPTFEAAMPEIPAPQFPEVPQIPAPQPPLEPVEPGPMPSPLTPQPDPDLPQPTIIPTPQPAPVPVPSPVPPGPTQPSSSASAVRRRLRAEEVTSGREISAVFSVLGGLAAIIAVVAMTSMRSGNFGPFQVIVPGVFGVLAVLAIRHAIFLGVIRSVKITPKDSIYLGAPLSLDIVIDTLKAVPVTEATITLIGEERAVSGGGKSKTVYQHTFCTQKVYLPTPAYWPGEAEMAFPTVVHIPADAPASYAGRDNAIDWSAVLWVGIPGWYPDIRQKLKLAVPPTRKGTPPAVLGVMQIPLTALKDLNATLLLECATGENGAPLLAAGQQVAYQLRIEPSTDSPQQRVWVELAYDVSGAGNKEGTTVTRHPCFRQGWQAGAPQTEQGTFTVPRNGPISFDGVHVIIRWVLIIRHDLPWQAAQRHVIEVVVEPAAVAS